MLDGGVGQGLDAHGDKRGRAAAHRSANKQQAALKLHHQAKLAQQVKHLGAYLRAHR